jgi:hypothetical protein
MVWSLKIVRWFVTDSLPVRRYRGALSVQKAPNFRTHRQLTPAPRVTTAGLAGNKLDKKVSRAWTASGTAPKPDFTCIDIARLRRCGIANAHKCALPGFVSILILNPDAPTMRAPLRRTVCEFCTNRSMEILRFHNSN